MRILFSSIGTYGHTYPLVPLAVAAHRAGHEVAFATSADFHDALKRLGLEPVAAGMPVFEAFPEALKIHFGTEDPYAAPRERLGELPAVVFGSVIPQRFIDDLLPAIERIRPDLVVAESVNFGASIAARLAGVPAVCHGVGRDPADEFSLASEAEVKRLTERYGWRLPEGRIDAFGDPFIDICPPSIQRPYLRERPGRLVLRPVLYTELDELPDGIVTRDRDRPLVYLSLGTVGGTLEILRTAVEGLSTLDADVLVTGGRMVDVDALGELPANVRRERWVSQPRLLPYTDLVVHHGGGGTMLGSFSVGVPQLILPGGGDTLSNAEAVRETGAGDRLLPAELTAEAVADRAGRILLEERYRDAARAVAAEIAGMPAPEEVAARLPELVR